MSTWIEPIETDWLINWSLCVHAWPLRLTRLRRSFCKHAVSGTQQSEWIPLISPFAHSRDHILNALAAPSRWNEVRLQSRILVQSKLCMLLALNRRVLLAWNMHAHSERPATAYRVPSLHSVVVVGRGCTAMLTNHGRQPQLILILANLESNIALITILHCTFSPFECAPIGWVCMQTSWLSLGCSCQCQHSWMKHPTAPSTRSFAQSDDM